MIEVRTEKKKNPYVMIDNRPINDRELSFGARGLLAYLLSKPDDWKVQMSDLVNGPDGASKVRGYLKELQKHGYAKLHRQRDEKGHVLGSEWIIREMPIQANQPGLQKPGSRFFRKSEKPDSGKTENRKNPESGKTPSIVSTDVLQSTEEIQKTEEEVVEATTTSSLPDLKKDLLCINWVKIDLEDKETAKYWTEWARQIWMDRDIEDLVELCLDIAYSGHSDKPLLLQRTGLDDDSFTTEIERFSDHVADTERKKGRKDTEIFTTLSKQKPRALKRRFEENWLININKQIA